MTRNDPNGYNLISGIHSINNSCHSPLPQKIPVAIVPGCFNTRSLSHALSPDSHTLYLSLLVSFQLLMIKIKSPHSTWSRVQI